MPAHQTRWDYVVFKPDGEIVKSGKSCCPPQHPINSVEVDGIPDLRMVEVPRTWRGMHKTHKIVDGKLVLKDQ